MLIETGEKQFLCYTWLGLHASDEGLAYAFHQASLSWKKWVHATPSAATFPVLPIF